MESLQEWGTKVSQSPEGSTLDFHFVLSPEALDHREP